MNMRFSAIRVLGELCPLFTGEEKTEIPIHRPHPGEGRDLGRGEGGSADFGELSLVFLTLKPRFVHLSYSVTKLTRSRPSPGWALV